MRRLVQRAVRILPIDRRMRFRDVHLIPPAERKAQSPILQFYSSKDNIGNFLPVAAIRNYLDCETDTWCIHHRVDFDYVNANYRAVVIGGAGLVYRPFESFWRDFADKCRLPFIIWGVGICSPDALSLEEAVPFIDVFDSVSRRASLVNVRDDLTASLSSRDDVSVTACPSVSYVTDFATSRKDGPITLAMHGGLVSQDEHKQLQRLLMSIDEVVTTQNIQNKLRGVDDILRTRYVGSSVVVTTRLHGAIIAYGLDIPYIALARDNKLRSFTRLYGGGVIANDVAQTEELLDSVRSFSGSSSTALLDVDFFAKQASAWMIDVLG
jgi:hypothetical protein